MENHSEDYTGGMTEVLNADELKDAEISTKKVSFTFNKNESKVSQNSSKGTRPEKKDSSKKTTKKNLSSVKHKQLVNAFDLYQLEEKDTPKLLDPFLQKVGVASIVGSSDTGKSSFLRQLALSIALGKEEFIGFKLNTDTQNVIYVSTEDDKFSTNSSIKKQLIELEVDSNIEDLKHLDFIFDTENLLDSLIDILSEKEVDLIVIDAFTDVFNDEINSNTKVRNFLSQYHNLAIKHNCLVIFLHHNGKRTESASPSKNNIIGSQAFEAKMRSVLEVRQGKDDEYRLLTLLKCNFLSSVYKNKSYVLKFSENLVFHNTNKEIAIGVHKIPKKDNPEIIKEVMKLHAEKLSTRKIEEQLKGTDLQVSKSVVSEIIKAL